MANPYKPEFFDALLGGQETQRLEFKSSRELLNENSQKRGKFISDQLVPTVSALLNTDGGQVVVGIEEKDGTAINLSNGVPRSRISWEQMQSAICDRIQPAVAGYVSVFPVQIGTALDGERLFAFVVDVKAGMTAYQADDKKYYVRRSGQTEAMEDKDIRLRMLAGDKPRLSVNLRNSIPPNIDSFIPSVYWTLSFENIGIRNIPRAIIRTTVNVEGLAALDRQFIKGGTPEYRQTTFPLDRLETEGLLPGQRFELPLFDTNVNAFLHCPDLTNVKIIADLVIYIDDGLSTELSNNDLLADLRPVILSQWTIQKD